MGFGELSKMEDIYKSVYSEKFIDDVSEKFDIDKENVKALADEFKSILQPEIETHYLSHLISSIENIINQDFRKKINENIKNATNNMEKSVAIAFINMLKNEKFRFYPILLRESSTLHIPAKMDIMINNGAIIYYSGVDDKKEIRIFIAHELGHIYFNHISKMKNIISNDDDEERYANAFAAFALCDKYFFYAKKSNSFLEPSCLTVLNKIESLLSYNSLREKNSKK